MDIFRMMWDKNFNLNAGFSKLFFEKEFKRFYR